MVPMWKCLNRKVCGDSSHKMPGKWLENTATIINDWRLENVTVLYELLEEVKVLMATDYAKRFKQGKNFNIFEVQGVLSDEVRVCRLLKELLDPAGSHGQRLLF